MHRAEQRVLISACLHVPHGSCSCSRDRPKSAAVNPFSDEGRGVNLCSCRPIYIYAAIFRLIPRATFHYVAVCTRIIHCVNIQLYEAQKLSVCLWLVADNGTSREHCRRHKTDDLFCNLWSALRFFRQFYPDGRVFYSWLTAGARFLFCYVLHKQRCNREVRSIVVVVVVVVVARGVTCNLDIWGVARALHLQHI